MHMDAAIIWKHGERPIPQFLDITFPKPFGNETELFRAIEINNMVVDALTPGVDRPSAAVPLPMLD